MVQCSRLTLSLCLRAPVTEVERLAAFLDAPRPTLSDTVNCKPRPNKASVLTLLAWSGRGHAPTTLARDPANWQPGRRAAAPAAPPDSTSADSTERSAAAAAAARAEPAKRHQLHGVKTLLGRLRDGAHAAQDPLPPAAAPAKEDKTFCMGNQGAQCTRNNPAHDTTATDSQREQHTLSSGGRAAAAAAAADKASRMERRSPLTGLLAAVRRLGGGRSRKTSYGALPCLTTT